MTNEGDEWEVTAEGLELTSYNADGVRKVHTNPQYCLEDIMLPEFRPRGVYALLCHMIDHDTHVINIEGEPAAVMSESDFVIDTLYPILNLFGALLVLLTLFLYITIICPTSRFSVTQKAMNICHMAILSTSLLLISFLDFYIDPNVFPMTCTVLGKYHKITS